LRLSPKNPTSNLNWQAGRRRSVPMWARFAIANSPQINYF
jgi:hypothetical protein